METLDIQSSCEINNLIRVIMERTAKTYAEVEKEAFDEYVYPESTKTYVDVRWPSKDDGWLKQEIIKLLNELGIQGIYITNPI